MGKKFPILKLREVIRILRNNGFKRIRQDGSSHARYVGSIKGKTCHVTVDMAVDEYEPKSFTPLDGIVKSQLGISYKQFYAGEPKTAKRAQLKYKRFGDC